MIAMDVRASCELAIYVSAMMCPFIYLCTLMNCTVHDVAEWEHCSVPKCPYRIVGNFGEVFSLANWQSNGKLPNLKFAIFYSDEI